MKILFIHSYYQVYGGEDSVFQHELDLIRSSNQVRSFSMHNKPGVLGSMQFVLSIWNSFVAKRLKDEIIDFSPDVIHIHNLHYAIGPIAIRVANRMEVPIVYTLHNYRLLCPSGSLMNNGHLFTDSIKAYFPWKAVRNKVFRHSYILTFWLSFIGWFHRVIKTWALVDRYIVLTDFAKEVYVSSTLNVLPEKFVVKPNFVVDYNNESTKRGSHFLYVGRLSEEKGTEVLLSAFAQVGYTLQIAGEGPLAGKVKRLSEGSENIHYLGPLDRSAVLQAMQTCNALIFPSIWYEGMPMVILEALSLGTPVIASNFGAMASLISHKENGLHFTVNDSNDLVDKLHFWSKLKEEQKEVYRSNAIDSYKLNFTPQANETQLLTIYRSLVKKADLIQV
ncbi:glycosyltransferase [Spirosoma soli]|uniref:Glycosyltransferase n=1 Tax=Spirosoma soli TaxID=1770529 RepID=A0ABW5M1E6_9BACT